MAETPHLADQTLARLRRLAEGNGLSANEIILKTAQEGIYTVDGQLSLTPLFESEAKTYPGSLTSKKTQAAANFAALQQNIEQRRQYFQQGIAWADEAVAELKKEPGCGWGHHGARVTLSSQCVTCGATESCPHCRGSGTQACPDCQGRQLLPCPQCAPYHGQGREPCYYCNGLGTFANDPSQPCNYCQGARFLSCRQCQGRATILCPSCQGRGGLTCTACNGQGSFSQEIAITAGAEINFQLDRNVDLPTELRRTMDRLGVQNLTAHADIEMVAPEDPAGSAGKAKVPPSNNRIKLQAKLPYAELQVQLGAETTKITVFGKKHRLGGVPTFLDKCLAVSRQQLAEAAKGSSGLAAALEARAIADGLGLIFAGRTKADDLRRLYPVGLSGDAAKEIMQNLQKALAAETRNMRMASAAAIFCVALTVIYFAVKSPFLAALTHLQGALLYGIHGLVLVLMLAVVWLALTQATRWLLGKKFKTSKIALQQNIGKFGYAAMGLLVLSYLALLMAKF